MGIIKNLMVRIGADARGFLSVMRNAANTTSYITQTVNKHTSTMKKAVSSSFSSSRMSVKEYAAAVSQTKEKHADAVQNAERLSDRIQQLRKTYDTVKTATQGLDMSKPLAEQISKTEKALDAINAKIHKTQAAISAIGSARTAGKAARLEALRIEMRELMAESDATAAHLYDLDQAANAVGESNIGYASAAGLKKLEDQIASTERELNTTKILTNELAEKMKSLRILPTVGRAIKSIGLEAAHAAGNGVSKLWGKLKSLGSSAIKGITSIPSKLRKIGTSASGSCGGLGKMARSIRNIGIVSLGMRIAGGMFGRLRSIISSYISQNEELNASVTALRNQFGEALMPAIKMVLVAVQKLMPAITAVSNGINSILTSLFGDMLETTAGIKKAADEANSLEVYGFDQITKTSDTTGDDTSNAGNTEAKQSALVQKLTGWIEKLKAAFVAGDWRKMGQTVGEGINSFFANLEKIDIGGRLGSFVNSVATAVNGALETTDWNIAGKTIGSALTALPDAIARFVLATNWGSVGQSISECLKSAVSTGTKWIQSVDWLQIGKNAAELIANVDWSGIVAELFQCFGASLGASVSLLWGFIGEAVDAIKKYFIEKIREAGGNVGKGLLNGILDGLGSIGTWISKNVISPFVRGFSGLNNGVVDVVENMINTVIGGINKLFGGLNKFLSIGKKVGIDLQIPTIGEVKLPRAARGTVVSRATKLEVGEDGTEAVMPLERHTEWMDVFATKLTAKMSGGGAGGTAIIQIILGNRKLTEYIIKDINQLTKENGVCPIRV